MYRRYAISTLALSISFALTGCAGTTSTLNSFGRTLASLGNAGPRGKQYAYVGARTEAMPGFLKRPKTVWVPAAYSQTGIDTFYIDGQPLYLRGQVANVGSFLDAGDGYIVAIRENNLRVAGQSLPLNRPGIVFYRVSATGKIGKQLGYYVTDARTPMVNSGKAIFLQESEPGSVKPALYRFVGFDASGNRVSGPQGVPFASPAPHGGWFVEQITGRSGFFTVTPGYSAEIVRDSSNGSQTVITPKLDVPYHARQWVHTTGAFVDAAPVTDTARTGAILRRYTGRFVGLDMVRLAQPMTQSCEGLIGKICQHQGPYEAATYGIVSNVAIQDSSVLFGTPQAQYLAMPFDPGAPTPYGIVEAIGPLSGHSKMGWVDLFPATGSVRGIYHLPSYGLIGPKRVVLVNADGGNTQSGLSYLVRYNQAGAKVAVLDANTVSQFLSRYGFRQVPVNFR